MKWESLSWVIATVTTLIAIVATCLLAHLVGILFLYEENRQMRARLQEMTEAAYLDEDHCGRLFEKMKDTNDKFERTWNLFTEDNSGTCAE